MAVSLNAEPRSERGKNAVRALRRAGKIPAVVYGHGDETRALTLDAHELQKLLSSTNASNTIIDLKIGGAGTQALIREVQYHPIRSQVLHVDLYQIHAGEKIHLVIPVRIHGTPVGVRDEGGVLQQVLHDLNVECLPRDIPEAVDVEVGELGIGDSIHVRDIELPKVKILNDPELTICSVTQPTVAALPEEAEAEDTVGGSVEPEVIRDRRTDDTPAEEG